MANAAQDPCNGLLQTENPPKTSNFVLWEERNDLQCWWEQGNGGGREGCVPKLQQGWSHQKQPMDVFNFKIINVFRA